MGLRFRCLRGHLWEDVFDQPSLIDGEIRCPECGTRSEPESSSALSQPTQVVSPCAPAEVQPASDALAEGPMPVTVVRPALAMAPFSSPPPDTSLEVHPAIRSDRPGPPIIPSRHLEAAGDAAASVTLPALPHRVEWPDVPGYEILGELGRGGMGVVYKARHSGLGHMVALKMILTGSQADERERARFHAEAVAVARLQHPNIVQIFDVGEHKGSAYFSLEFVDGGSLADRLKGHPLTMGDSSRLVETLARAIHFAHENGIVHRDLKPANILLHRDRAANAPEPGTSGSASGIAAVVRLMPKITDFGLAKTLDQDIQNTRSGMVVGTPGYMAPEQATGQTNIGPAADIWSLGVILYQLVTGKLPFLGDTPMDVMLKVTQEDPPPPSRYVPRLARDLETILLKCLEKDPRRRYATAADLAEDLRRFQAHEPIQARPIRTWEHVVRWGKRRPAVTGMLATGMLGVLALLGSFGMHTRTERLRLRTLRTEVRQAVEHAQESARRGAWEDVRGLLEVPSRQVASNPPLADFSDSVADLVRQAEGQLAARAAFRAFDAARNEALFQATLAAGIGDPAHWERTRQRTTEALKLVGASAGQGPDENPFFTAREAAAIRRGCYELFLVLAETAAFLPPGAPAAEQRPHGQAALAILDTAASLDLSTHAFHLRRTRYLEQVGKPDLAAQEKQRAARQPAETDLDHYLVGSEFYRQGNLALAEASFVEALRLRPELFWARYFLALCHVRGGQLIAARDNLTSCLGQQPRVVWIFLLRGFVQGQLGQFHSAESDFQAALAQLQTQPDPGALYVLYNNRAVTRIAQHKYDWAEQDLQRAIKVQPDGYQAHVTLSQMYQQQKDLGAALTALDRAIGIAGGQLARRQLDAGTVEVLHRMRYRILLEQRAPEAALAELQSILNLPDLAAAPRARALCDRGHLLLRQGRSGPALAEYDAALVLAPQDAELYRWRAEVLLRLHRYAEAVTAYNRYLEKGGKPLVGVYRGRALARLQLSDREAALADLTLALGLDPTDASLRLHRGRTYLACQAWQLAVQDFDGVLAHQADNVAAYQGRATARLQLGQVRQATADADAVARLGAEDPRLVYSAACLLVQAAGQLDGTGPVVLVRSERLRQQDRALQLLGTALERLPAPERTPFWRGTVIRDGILTSLSSRPTYQQLDRQYGARQ